jgi:hypothetical protein
MFRMALHFAAMAAVTVGTYAVALGCGADTGLAAAFAFAATAFAATIAAAPAALAAAFAAAAAFGATIAAAFAFAAFAAALAAAIAAADELRVRRGWAYALTALQFGLVLGSLLLASTWLPVALAAAGSALAVAAFGRIAARWADLPPEPEPESEPAG